jgi:hypothetical protein
MPMQEGAWVFPLGDPFLVEVERGVLTLQEAWQLMDAALLTNAPGIPWPEEVWPLVERIRFADLPTSSTVH